MTQEELASLLIPTEALFQSLQEIRRPAFFEKLCRGGCEIYLKKLNLKTHFEIGERVRLCRENGDFYALGEIGEHENGIAVKAIKTFFLE